MMNSGESSGMSSSCGQENGAASSDPERPHKKARFPWQIKGKHHLKNQMDQGTENHAVVEPKQITSTSESVTCMSNKISTDGSSFTLKKKVETNTAKETKRLIWQGSGRPPLPPDGNPFLPLQTVISLAESMLMRSVTGGTDHLDSSRDALNNILELNLETVPSSPLISARKARRLSRDEDKLISRWQESQYAIGCYDNTVNSVLDAWISASRSTEERSITLNLARVMNDIPPYDNEVEDEAILMAINAHGLQNVPTVAGVPAIAPSEQLARTLASDIPICEDSDSSICSEDFELPFEQDSYYPWPLDDPVTQNVDQSQLSDEETGSVKHPWRQIHDNRHANQRAPCQYRDNSQTTTGEDYEYEFINTAIIQAIKSKGLMAAGTDFG